MASTTKRNVKTMCDDEARYLKSIITNDKYTNFYNYNKKTNNKNFNINER